MAKREEAGCDTVLAIGKAEGGEEEGQTTECVEVWVHKLNSRGGEETKLTKTVYSHKKKKRK